MPIHSIGRLTDDDVFLFNEGTHFNCTTNSARISAASMVNKGLTLRYGRRKQSGCPSSDPSTTGRTERICSIREDILEFGKDSFLRLRKGPCISIHDQSRYSGYQVDKSDPSPSSMKFLPSRHRSSGISTISGLMPTGCTSADNRMLWTHLSPFMKCMWDRGDGSPRNRTDR